jgi:hypothetical protein
VVEPAAGRVIEHLHAYLLAVLVVEVEHATGLEVVVARELLLAGLEVHLATSVEEHVHHPPKKATASLPPQQRADSMLATKLENLSGGLWMPSVSPLRTTMNSNSYSPSEDDDGESDSDRGGHFAMNCIS